MKFRSTRKRGPSPSEAAVERTSARKKPKGEDKAKDKEAKVEKTNNAKVKSKENVKGNNRTKNHAEDIKKAKAVEASSKDVTKNSNNKKANTPTPTRASTRNQVKSVGKKTQPPPKVKKAAPIKAKVTPAPPPPPAAEPEKKNVPVVAPRGRGRPKRTDAKPQEQPGKETESPAKIEQVPKQTVVNARPKRVPQKRKLLMDEEDITSKPKVTKRKSAKKSAASAKVEKTSQTKAAGQTQVETVQITSGEKSSIQLSQIIEEQVVSPQILDPGASTSNGVPLLQTSDLLMAESSPQRFTKMIMQPSQELPAEIFQNEQNITLTSPQKSSKVLKFVVNTQATGQSLLQGLNPLKGPAVIVRQNSAAGDVGNPDQITCLNVFNGSPRRSIGGNDSNGENGPSTSDGRGDGDDGSSVTTYNPSSPGKLVGEGLHNYCKSPLLAPAGTFPPSAPVTTAVAAAAATTAVGTTISSKAHVQPVKKGGSSGQPEVQEKKARKRSVSSSIVVVPPADAPRRRIVSATPAAVGPNPTRRSSRGTAGIPPKRDSMIEIPIVNRRRTTSTTNVL